MPAGLRRLRVEEVTKKTFPTRIGLAPEVREEMIALLNQQLADTFDLYVDT